MIVIALIVIIPLITCFCLIVATCIFRYQDKEIMYMDFELNKFTASKKKDYNKMNEDI